MSFVHTGRGHPGLHNPERLQESCRGGRPRLPFFESSVAFLCVPLCPLWLRFSQRERTSDRSINQPARDRTVAIDSPIPQERPITARVFEQAQINFANQDFFLIM
jgi:hypothetical protein